MPATSLVFILFSCRVGAVSDLTGNPNIDSCETDKEKTFFTNTMVPIGLANACNKFGIHFIQLSSGCCFRSDRKSQYRQLRDRQRENLLHKHNGSNRFSQCLQQVWYSFYSVVEWVLFPI